MLLQMREMKITFYCFIFGLLFINSVSFSQDLTITSHKSPDSSAFIEHNPTNLFIGVGNAFYFKKFAPNYFNWNLTLNFNIKLSKYFCFMLGLDLYDHHASQDAGMLYIGPSYKLFLSRSKFDIYARFSVAGVIASGENGVGFGGCVIISPTCEYFANKFVSISFELRNVISGIFFTNPLLGIHLNMP